MRRRLREIAMIAVTVFVVAAYGDYQKKQAVEAIKGQLNSLGRNLCLDSERVDAVGNYNELIKVLTDDYRARQTENEQRGDVDKALINASTISAINAARIEQAPADCSEPLLP